MTKPRHDTLHLCAMAIERLKAAGFRRRAVSMKSEATYWYLPGRHGVLRVSAHKSKHRWMGSEPVVSRLTFAGRDHAGAPVLVCSAQAIEAMIHMAVGEYVLQSEVISSPDSASDSG